jgi:radical SAM superfamily enzyme with C-terminal helix-hairpin-helix motif
MTRIVAIVDCYTVEPSGLGVPPYLSTYARAAFGALTHKVPHRGNTNASSEEAREVARLTAQLTSQTWRDKEENERPVCPGDILILTPYKHVANAN